MTKEERDSKKVYDAVLTIGRTMDLSDYHIMMMLDDVWNLIEKYKETESMMEY